ncbi:uracil-DNA glycosylase [Natronomonas salina]|uniref:uracil-DNA glycosylase family protein n=1 Tax=Natronomonas salina TaxID=1710540 RepID=UPI0015B47BF2|nr:uracil-DNA glycosylase family protein [Natronomonas salina]QLD87508.1 uracil-DNA glycosylase [Natronomonas salina]
MKRVTDRVSNPFGMRAPGEPAVYGYGDANADFHVLGADADTHGGAETGVPFTGSTAGERLQAVLHAVGFAAEPYSDAPDLSNCYLSYLRLSPGDPAVLEPFADAELRAINAHILLPVGDDALSYVLEEFTTQARALPHDAAELHASEVRGRGFLVVPVKDPADWEVGDREALVERLAALLASDYRQTKGVATTVG